MIIGKYGETGREQLRSVLAAPNPKHVRSAWEGRPHPLLLSLETGRPALSPGFPIWKTRTAAVPLLGRVMWNPEFTDSAAGVQRVLRDPSLCGPTSGSFSVRPWDWLPWKSPGLSAVPGVCRMGPDASGRHLGLSVPGVCSLPSPLPLLHGLTVLCYSSLSAPAPSSSHLHPPEAAPHSFSLLLEHSLWRPLFYSCRGEEVGLAVSLCSPSQARWILSSH